MKKIYMVVFAMVVMLATNLSATALEYKTVYRQNGVAAYAEWDDITPTGYAYTYLSVTKTDDGTDIYLSICSPDAAGNYNCKWGYKFTQENVFDVNKKLESAALSEVQIDLYDSWYMPAGTSTIKAQWTGVGDVTKGSYKSMSKYGDYMSKYSDSSSFRQATATGALNGLDLGTSDYGGMVEFKSASMYMQK